MQELQGRVAVVTGAASGIGLGIASAFANEGMRLVLADLDRARLAAEAARLTEAGHEVETVVTDVGDPDAVAALGAATMARFGVVHVVCNNAGVVTAGKTWEIPLTEWERVLRINLMGVIHGVRTFVPLLLQSGEEGHVVNVASMAAVMAVPGIAPYSVAKHGVLALSETMHMELSAAGAPIGVTVVMPGRVRTRLGLAPDAAERPATPDPDIIEPAVVGAQVVEAIRANRLHLFTHPDRLPDVARRFALTTDD